MAAAGLGDFALYRLQLHARSTFEPPAYIIHSASGFSALIVAFFLVTAAWLGLRTASSTGPAGLILLLLGLPAAFDSSLLAGGLLRWLPGVTLLVVQFFGDQFRLAGAFLTVLGLALILKTYRERS